MLPSVLIKVKTRGVGGRKGMWGARLALLTHPGPTVTQESGGGRAAAPAARGGNGIEELGDESPGTHTPKCA